MTDHVKALRDIAENPEPMGEAGVQRPACASIGLTDSGEIFVEDNGVKWVRRNGAWHRINGGMHPK